MAQEEYIGLAPRGGQLEWAALRRRPGRAEPIRSGSLAVVGPPPDWRATLGHLKPPLAGPCVLGLPSEQVLLRVVELPSTDLKELAGMVPLQLDKISPFPVEQLEVGFEWLASAAQKSRVLVVAVRRENLDQWAAALEQGALALERVDVQGLVWWHLLRARPAPDSAQQLYLIHDGQDTELIVVRQQIPVVFRSLGGGRALDEPGDAAEVAEEVAYTLAAVEAEWGARGPTQLQVWTTDEAPGALTKALARIEVGPLSTHRLGTLPPVAQGLAERALEARPGQLNLAPPHWQAQRSHRATLRKFGAAGSILLTAWLMAILLLWLGLRREKLALAHLNQQAQTVESQATAVRAVRDKVFALEQYADRSRSALEVLREITVHLPAGVDLTSFIYRKGRHVTLRGETDRVEAIYDFIQALQGSALFTTVESEGIASRARQGRSVVEFTKITANLPGGAAP